MNSCDVGTGAICDTCKQRMTGLPENHGSPPSKLSSSCRSQSWRSCGTRVNNVEVVAAAQLLRLPFEKFHTDKLSSPPYLSVFSSPLMPGRSCSACPSHHISQSAGETFIVPDHHLIVLLMLSTR